MLLRSFPAATLAALAAAVVESDAAFGLFTGYANWDGVDPEVDESALDTGGSTPRVGAGA